MKRRQDQQELEAKQQELEQIQKLLSKKKKTPSPDEPPSERYVTAFVCLSVRHAVISVTGFHVSDILLFLTFLPAAFPMMDGKRQSDPTPVPDLLLVPQVSPIAKCLHQTHAIAARL